MNEFTSASACGSYRNHTEFYSKLLLSIIPNPTETNHYNGSVVESWRVSFGKREAPFSPVLPEFLPRFRQSEECLNESAQQKQQL